jgi:hypothetical protein
MDLPTARSHVLFVALLALGAGGCGGGGSSAEPTGPVTGTLPLGSLAHDGPATPEQISLVLPVTGVLPQTATATVRYRQSGSPQWRTGHPLFRVQPAFSEFPQAGGAVEDVFAWPIVDLTPGTSYDVEVTVASGGVIDLKTLAHTTRALPPAAGTPNKSAASPAEIASQLSALDPGDVLEIAVGTHDVNSLTISRSGTSAQPIYIRGASRTGTVLRDTTGSIVSIAASHVIIENMTLQGAGVDGGLSSPHTGVSLSSAGQTRITLRNLRIIGVDRGVNFISEATQTLVYDNTLVGNNLWSLAPVNYLQSNVTWDDEGIKLPGSGNVAFQNTISRFGDSFAYASHNSGAETNSIGVHFYRNEVRNSGDDLIEADHGRRNLSWYDNRSHNSMNCGSLDPLYGGPWLSARNICINPYRVNTHKWNNQNSGQFLYNNTVIGTTSRGTDADVANWYQPDNGPQRSYAYRNNVHVYHGNGQSIWLESTVHDPIDWTHNSWYPDRAIQWDGAVFGNLAQAQAGLADTTPIFSGTQRRMQSDNITVANPWTTTIMLGAESLIEVTQTFTPVLAAGTSPKNSGVAIPNITDGSSGAAPDRGAIISGRPIPQYGDSSP